MPKSTKGNASEAAKNGTPPAGNHQGDIRWINAELNTQDISVLESDLNHALQRVVELYEGLRDSQRLSVKLDSRSGRWLAILFDRSDSEEWTTVALSLRAATPLDALISLAYVALVKYADGWQSAGAGHKGRFG